MKETGKRGFGEISGLLAFGSRYPEPIPSIYRIGMDLRVWVYADLTKAEDD